MIDLWDLNTLPPATTSLLARGEQLIRNHVNKDHTIGVARANAGLKGNIPSNEFGDDMSDLKREIETSVKLESLRTFHYTRMTDAEVAVIVRNGITMTSLSMFRRKLDDVVASGHITRAAVDDVYAKSPIVTGRHGERGNKFWSCAIPYPITDDRIETFLRCWGGEISRWELPDEGKAAGLMAIGRPRVIEVVLPIERACGGFAASRIADQIVEAFKHGLGLTSYFRGADIYVEHALPPQSVIKVHSQGDATFSGMGLTYPATYFVRP
jgi:hypothetical protein